MTSSSYNLTFSRLRASFTVDKELIGKQDPYVIFTSGSAKAQTKAIKGVGTGTAEWKESYTLEKFSPSSNSVIEVNVWNHNTLLPDNIIGSGTVDLSSQGQSSLSGSGDPVSVILVDKKGQETGTLSFVVNGGGYSGSGTGRSGVSSGTGVTSGTGVGAGGNSGSNTGYSGTGSNTGYSGSNTGASSDGTLVGKGYGTSQSTAQRASDQAAATGKTAILEEKSGLGVGHPVQSGSSGKGIGSSSTTSDYSGSRGTGTGSGITSGTGTGVTSGTGTGITSGTAGVAVRGVAASDRTVYGEREGDVIDRKYYVGTESRPQDQALVETYREHNPYAKDYETTVQHTGRERLVQSQIEALGTRERVVTQDHLVYAHPHHEIARHLPAGALSERPGGEGWVQTKAGPICDTNTFSISGDRTVDKERVTDLREHREFEKEFEVKTRLVGERLLNRGTEAEILNRERVLVDEKSKIACEGHPSAAVSSGETLASTGYTGTGTNTGYTGTGTNTGYTGTGTNTGTGYSSSGTNTGYSGTGTGVGSGTGSGYNNSGRNTTGQTTGEKIASYIPGSEENKEKKGQTTGSGYGTGSGYSTGQTTGSGYGSGQTTGSGYGQSGTGQTTGEKVASYIPGSEENKEKKAAQYA